MILLINPSDRKQQLWLLPEFGFEKKVLVVLTALYPLQEIEISEVMFWLTWLGWSWWNEILSSSPIARKRNNKESELEDANNILRRHFDEPDWKKKKTWSVMVKRWETCEKVIVVSSYVITTDNADPNWYESFEVYWMSRKVMGTDWAPYKVKNTHCTPLIAWEFGICFNFGWR